MTLEDPGNMEKFAPQKGSHTDMRFGLIAVEKRHVSAKQFAEASMIQVREELEKSPPRSIGEILVDLGYMNHFQVEEVLSEMKILEGDNEDYKG